MLWRCCSAPDETSCASALPLFHAMPDVPRALTLSHSTRTDANLLATAALCQPHTLEQCHLTRSTVTPSAAVCAATVFVGQLIDHPLLLTLAPPYQRHASHTRGNALAEAPSDPFDGDAICCNMRCNSAFWPID
jgi:hypothetical protein